MAMTRGNPREFANEEGCPQILSTLEQAAEMQDIDHMVALEWIQEADVPLGANILVGPRT